MFRRGAFSVLFAFVLVALGGGGTAEAQGAPSPVVDPSGVLTEDERTFLANAVLDARDRTPYLATVLVVSDLAGRDPAVLVDELVRPPEGGEQVPMTLVVSQGTPPEVTIVVPDDQADELADVVTYAEAGARSDAASGGLPRAGLGFTAALIEGTPETFEVPAWIKLLAVAIAAFSAWRTFREWRRVKAIPSSVGEIASADGHPILATGQIVESAHTFSMLGVDRLVYFHAEQHWKVPTLTRYTNGYGDSWYEDGPDRHESDSESDAVPFVVQDGSGAAWVNPGGAIVQAPVLDKRGWMFSDSSSKISGLRVGDWITVIGRCQPQQDGSRAFVGRSRRDVRVFAKDPKAAYRTVRRGLWKRFAWTGFWLVVLLIVLTMQGA